MYIEEWILEKLLREEAERRQTNPGSVLDVPFFRVQSERFLKNEQELKAYEMPITKIILDNSVKAMSDEIDNQHIVDSLMYVYEHLHKEKK